MGMLLSRAEAAAYLGISAKLLDGFRKDGKISYVQRVPGGKVFLSKEELLFEIPKENGASAGGARYAADCGAADLASFLYGLLQLSETGLPQLRRFCRLEKLF